MFTYSGVLVILRKMLFFNFTSCKVLCATTFTNIDVSLFFSIEPSEKIKYKESQMGFCDTMTIYPVAIPAYLESLIPLLEDHRELRSLAAISRIDDHSSIAQQQLEIGNQGT